MNTCQYCQTEIPETAKNCWRCGGPTPEKDSVLKYDPFYFRGYMVWPERHCNSLVYHFWLGSQYIHTVEVDYLMIAELTKPGEDYTYLIYDLFKLSIGEKEVLEVEQRNEFHLIRFEIKRTVEY